MSPAAANANPYLKSRSTVAQLRLKLDEDERRRQREFNAFKEIKRSIIGIYETEQTIPEMNHDKAPVGVNRKFDTAEEALRNLKEGNKKFLDKEADMENKGFCMMELHLGQKPHAIIVTCSDSRVSPELIFNQGLGDLFVIRLAGNTLDTLGRASVLYAIQHLGAPLVVIMGHQECGAVKAALCPDEALMKEPADIKELVTHIRDGLKHAFRNGTDDEKVLSAVVCNVHHEVRDLQNHPDVSFLIRTQGVKVVGAYYGFNGGVTFFEPAPTNEPPVVYQEVVTSRATKPTSRNVAQQSSSSPPSQALAPTPAPMPTTMKVVGGTTAAAGGMSSPHRAGAEQKSGGGWFYSR